jgi:membrane-bound lytic murein transglycosylase D
MSYLSYLYITKARASGLLVLACYNYGPTRINKNLDEVPDDPRERNFWNFYQKGWVPEETRKYVMRIFTSALICENPQLFGFSAYFRQPD